MTLPLLYYNCEQNTPLKSYFWYMGIFTNDRYQPYTLSILLLLGIYFWMSCFDWKIPDTVKITNLANILITVISIFMGFLWVGLTLVYQSQDNKNIKILKANTGFYPLLLSYFKHSLIVSVIAIVTSVLFALGATINLYSFHFFMFIHILVLAMNYRVTHFLFKIISE